MEPSTTNLAAAENASVGKADLDALRVVSPELRQLQRDLLQVVTSSEDRQSLLSAIGSILTESVSLAVLAYFHRDDEDQLSPGWRMVPGGTNGDAEAIQKQLFLISDPACNKGRCHVDEIDGVDGCLAIAAPVFLRHRPPEAFAVVLPETTRAPERVILILELVASHITLWYVLQATSELEIEAQNNAALLELVGKLEASDDLRHACYTLVCELQEYLSCDLVAIGLRHARKGECRLQAISGTAHFDRNSEFTRAFEAAFDETVLRGTCAVWPTSSDSQRHATLAQQKLTSLADAEVAIASPLLDEHGEAVGAWVFLGDEQFGQQASAMNLIRAAQQPVGGSLRFVKRAEPGPVARLVRTAVESRRTWRGKVALLATCMLIGVLAIPMPYKIRCDCEMQPVVRRFVAAPFDGKLERALVALGDVISEGDLLARMDGRQIRLELAELTAERGRVAKQRDVALASQDVAAAQLAKLNMERLDVNLQMLRRRAAHLDITSPIDGSVISGDHEKDEGAPLTMGQALFEIAPLETMTAEVAVPEDDIVYVRKGLEVIIVLDAYPKGTWSGTIVKVHPRSEEKNNQNVFVAEVVLENLDAVLRPGMKGRAKVVADRRCMAWNLFHKSWDYLASMLR